MLFPPPCHSSLAIELLHKYLKNLFFLSRSDTFQPPLTVSVLGTGCLSGQFGSDQSLPAGIRSISISPKQVTSFVQHGECIGDFMGMELE